MSGLPGLEEIRAAAEVVYQNMPATPQYSWPLLNARAGAEVWVKHENHTPVGAFKIRGGLLYFERLREQRSEVTTVISATRGNHGQSLAFAASRYGVRTVIVVPFGNSREKNAAMRALGAELVEFGEDFQAASEHAMQLEREHGWHRVKSFDMPLVEGVATYALELEFLSAAPEMDTVYVAIGMGSGIAGMIAARNALGLKTKVVGVTSSQARATVLSLEKGEVVESPVTTVIADGVACRKPDAAAEAAMRAYFSDTHNVAEGAGAIGLAALLKDRPRGGARVGTVLSGGNVDSDVFARVMREG